jgi:tetratricopeptide (TPR) repeat protein
VDEALADANRALELEPTNAFALTCRAYAYIDKKHPDKAIIDCNAVLTTNRNFSLAYVIRGVAYAKKRDYQRAVVDCKKALHQDAQLVTAYRELGWLLATSPSPECRDGKLALECANRAFEMTKGNDWSVLVALAASHAECGSFEESVKWAQKALDLAPESERATIRSALDLYQARKPYRETD